MLATGKSPSDVAHQVGVTVHSIYEWNADPTFARYVNKLADEHAMQTVKVHAQAEQKLQGLIDEAVEQLSWLMCSSKSESVKEKAALDILHLAGLKPKERHEVEQKSTDHLVLTDLGGMDMTDYDDDDDDDDGLDDYDAEDEAVNPSASLMDEVNNILYGKDNTGE